MEKRNHFKTLTLSLLSALVLCGCGGTDNNNTLNIRGVKLGYGVDWMKNIIAAYQNKTGNKVKLTTLDGQAGVEALQGEIEAGGEKNTDIYFSRITDFYKFAYQDFFVDLTDLYTQKDPISGKSIEERTEKDFLNAYKVNNKYVGLSWANGVFGIIKNNIIWDALNLTDDDIPQTTDELISLCKRVANLEYKYDGNQIYPFVYSYESEYYSTLFPTWFSQYEGSENMNYFNNGIDPDDPVGSELHHTSNFYVRDGIVESLKVIEDLLIKNTNFHHPRSKSYQFSTAQNDFLRNKTSLFMVNGSWLESETTVKDYKIEFIDTPIVSSIINNGKIKTIKDDETLSLVVKYVRGINKEKPAGVSEEDIEIIKDAVNCGSLVRSGVDHHLVVSKKSKKIDLAKDFLKFMYSDEGLSIYRNTMNGGTLSTKPATPFTDDSNVSAFKANVNKKLEEGNFTDYEAQVPCKLYCYGGINRYCTNGLGNFGGNAIKAMVDFEKTPQEIFNLNKKFLDDNWASILKESGLQ